MLLYGNVHAHTTTPCLKKKSNQCGLVRAPPAEHLWSLAGLEFELDDGRKFPPFGRLEVHLFIVQCRWGSIIYK